jgi:hypothetical protein
MKGSVTKEKTERIEGKKIARLRTRHVLEDFPVHLNPSGPIIHSAPDLNYG